MNKKLTYSLLVAVVVMGVYTLAFVAKSSASNEQKQIEASHGHEDKDEHAHGEDHADHSEGEEHPHGDKDEHAHEQEQKKDEENHGHDHEEKEIPQPEENHKEEGGHEDEHGHGESEGAGDQAQLTEKAIENSGIKLMQATNAQVQQTLPLTGRIALNQNKTALVKARFEGVVREVTKAQGESVKAGDILATVEGNESLQVYPVKSPIDGIILSRTTNIGDVAGDTPMFTIADMNELWVEFHVFSQDSDRVASGIPVNISSNECEKTQDTVIQSLLPITEASSQTLLARATIKNLDSHWLPGMSVRGDVVVDSRDVQLAVKTSALQQMEGQTVIFVKEDESFKMRPVKTGISSKEWTEITDGLKVGETYVSEGSFTVKAEIGKASAEHAH